MRPALVLAALLLTVPGGEALATDVDGPDCGRSINDYGDAPEGVTLYPLTRPAAYPTCVAPGPIGTVENVAPIRGTLPGPAGYVRHFQSGGANYWLGCTVSPFGFGGIDSENNGKFSLVPGTPACGDGPLPDCGAVFGQDECDGDSDAGVTANLYACSPFPAQVVIVTTACAGGRDVYVNVLVDLNDDGDWNDNVACRAANSPSCVGPCTSPDGAAHEWAVKNLRITLPGGGCLQQALPPFEPGARVVSPVVWMRVSLTDAPVSDDFPWAGGVFAGGETEDYLVDMASLDPPVPARKNTWGELKIRYR